MSLKTTLKSIQDILRKDSGLDGDPQRISQLVWMLFLKMFDDTEVSNKTPIPDYHKWRNWTKREQEDEKLIIYVNTELFPTLRNLPDVKGQIPRAKLVEEIFKNSFNYMTSGSLMRQVINKIDSEFNFGSEKNRHLFNDIYEIILKDIQNSRYSGEYYTPRPVTRFIAEVLKPKLGEIVLDPACGTGGFLSSVTDYIKNELGSERYKWNEHTYVNIRGIEKKSLPFMLCVTNLLLHEIDVPNITRNNAFFKPIDEIQDKDKVDLIITNPPFGGIEEDSIIKTFSKDIVTKDTADLFLLLIMKLLKHNGRSGIVLPDGFLFGSGVKVKIKEKLFKECSVSVIYRLPRGVFAPYTDINSNIIFFEKGKATEKVWFYEHPLPKSRNNKYTKSNPIMYEEFLDPIKWFENPNLTENAWEVSIKQIQDNDYNLNFENPSRSRSEEVSESTEEVLQIILKNQKNINTIISKIKKEFIL